MLLILTVFAGVFHTQHTNGEQGEGLVHQPDGQGRHGREIEQPHKAQQQEDLKAYGKERHDEGEPGQQAHDNAADGVVEKELGAVLEQLKQGGLKPGVEQEQHSGKAQKHCGKDGGDKKRNQRVLLPVENIKNQAGDKKYINGQQDDPCQSRAHEAFAKGAEKGPVAGLFFDGRAQAGIQGGQRSPHGDQRDRAQQKKQVQKHNVSQQLQKTQKREFAVFFHWELLSYPKGIWNFSVNPLYNRTTKKAITKRK